MTGRLTLLGTAVLALLAAPASAQLRPQARPDDLAVTVAAVASAVALATPVAAPPAAVETPRLGPETGLPLPRFVSLKTGEGNARRGPSLDHRIDWVFLREDMPLMITAEYDNWRRVEDREGLGGWVHYSLLSGTRTVIVDVDRLPLRLRPDDGAAETALVEAGVVARVEICEALWCRISAGGYRGWVPKDAIWGVGADEVID